jgi:hypothetical protein
MSVRTSLYYRRGSGGKVAIEDMSVSTGIRLFVDSTNASCSDATTHGATPDKPLATLDYALGMCTANANDIIYLMPGHNEGAGDAQWTVDVAGVQIIGLGRGSKKPRFDFDHANASIDITANDVVIKNIALLPSVTAVAIGIDVTAGILNTVLEDVDILNGEDGAGVDEFVLGVDIKAGCTKTRIRRMKAECHASTANANAVISLTGASDRVTIEDCDLVIVGAAAVAPIKGITTLSTNVRVRGCTLVTDDEPCIELLTGTTGVLSDNDCFTNLATIAAAIVADGCALFRNEYVEVGNESNARIGTPSADD